MKVLLIGYHNPHFVNTIVYRERALRELGHDLISFDENSYILPGRVRQWFSALQQWDLKRMNRQLIQLVQEKKPDVCVVIGGHTMLPETVSAIHQMGIPIGLWTTDVPINFELILEGAPFYNHLFCAGTEASDIFHAKGCKHVSWLPFACDPHVHKQISLSAQEQTNYGRDIIFVGSYYPNRAKVLESIADYHVGVWGPYWEKLGPNSPLKQKAVNIKMNHDQWVKIFNASKINLVVHYQDGKVPCHQASPKLFEAMACGCFVITDRQKDVQALFKDQEHVVFFDDENDLRAKIRYYLDHPDQRARIAEQGYQQVIKQHTYQQRMKHMLDVLLK